MEGKVVFFNRDSRLLKPRTRSWREARRAYMVWCPFIFYTSLWSLLPLLYGLYLGFTEYNALGRPPVWVGLKNFRTFFATSEYIELLGRQLLLGGLLLVSNTVVSFIFALLLNVKSRLKGIYRTTIYVPSIAAATATAATFVGLLNPLSTQGLNSLITALGGTAVTWNYSQFWMFFWIVVYSVWRGAGPTAIIWLGGLQGIDPSLYEAARVDGASFWQQVRFITLPGLRFIALFILLTGIIGSMQAFDTVMFISGGGPYGQTDVLAYRIYKDGFLSFNLGMAGAESLILSLITVVFALGYLKVQQMGGEGE
jgi:ABC-type sugar transport system permease subunit